MKQVLQDYIQIHSIYPETIPLSKNQRKQKHNQLMKWLQTEYSDMPNFLEVISFLKEHHSLPVSKPFFQKILIPPVCYDIYNNSYQSLKTLFEITPYEDINTDKDLIFLLQEVCHFQYNVKQLTDMVLLSDPEHIAALRYRYRILESFLSFSIHEVPSGILNGMNGADLNQLPFLQKDLQEFQEISYKLGLYHQNKDFIQYCYVLYTAYADYLSSSAFYPNFKTYLDSLHIIY